MPDTGTAETKSGDLHEVWGVLPAVAAVTQRVRVGTLVSPDIDPPPSAAGQPRVDHRPRVGRSEVLGLGAGWQINEHAAYGFDLGARVSRFEEAVQIVRELLTTARTTFRGRFYEVVDAPCDPKPVQSPLPILVGAKGPRMLRITARYADEWNAWSDADSAGPLRQRLIDACDEVGRDPATIGTSVNALISLDAEPPVAG